MDTGLNPTKNWFEEDGIQYAAFRPDYPAELGEALSKIIQHHHTAWDVGCGSGQLTSLLSQHFTNVIGTDPSAEQLKFAKTGSGIRYLQEPAEQTSIQSNSVNLIVAAQAAHWFNLEAFYNEAKRVANEEAVIALISYGVPYIEASVNSCFQQGYWQTIHKFWPKERSHVENGYRDIPFPFQALFFPNCFIHQEMNYHEFVSYISTWSAYKKAQQLNELETFHTFLEQLSKCWGDLTQSHQITWPISVKAGKVVFTDNEIGLLKKGEPS